MKKILVRLLKKNKNLFDIEIANKFLLENPNAKNNIEAVRRRVVDLRREYNLHADTINVEEYKKYILQVSAKYEDYNYSELARIVKLKYPFSINKIRHDISAMRRFGENSIEYKKTNSRK